MEASDFKDDHLLKFKKIGNKYPVSVIILVVVIWLHTMCCNEVKDRLVNENYLQQIFEGAMIVLAFTGATFTDSWLGKYNALIGSIIFLIFTQITIIVKESLIKDFYISWIFDIFGLFFLSLAFCIQMSCEYCLAGDQFPLYQVKERKKIFSSLYLSTTFGILFADIFAHLIWVSKWFSKSYSLLLSGILMGTMSLILVTILWCKKFFFIEHPKGSALLEIFKCILFAMKNKLIHCSWKTPKRDHWLDWASEKYSENNIKAVKLFFRLLLFILPFPIFWALVNKQERKWDYQAIQMSHILYPNYDAIDLDSDQDVFQLRVSSSTWFKKEEILLEEKTIYLLILSGKETLYSITLMKEDYEKPENGLAHVRIFNTLDKDIYIMLLVDTFRLQKHNGYSPQLSIRISRKVNLFYMIEEKKEVLQLKAGLLKFGSSYLLFIIQHVPVVKIHKVKLVQVKSFSVAWQFPQLFIKDLGRYFLTISCMEFFYYEAPKGLKVTMTALWTSTLYSSYIIMNFVSYISLLPEWIEYFLISCILLSIITAFFIISYYYKESYRENPSSEFTIIGNR
ncbi:solute carrier family 15 member 2-like isoform X4 [Sarcophilus harrisii]|uniref:solute carrier family 15 member 2-like isoform X4 n=1 Tax=Sarcophilus harrisii TaxID=9305 RepID=UPI00062B3B52|nr:solute carrier family 15 member 2-like isoform X4 [Sarcophilus harrisii]